MSIILHLFWFRFILEIFEEHLEWDGYNIFAFHLGFKGYFLKFVFPRDRLKYRSLDFCLNLPKLQITYRPHPILKKISQFTNTIEDKYRWSFKICR